ncbi:MAG TPA: Uma2 family endonuclease [Aquifex aeolicus]|uniref:Uma2 family endonuclease n=1 Tax=Aquifex aeolicus TaxID=63363 RepID=A0A7C5L6S5_AQUAO|nr:Uma2 family endonuclease [Aquifex aeolicus]
MSVLSKKRTTRRVPKELIYEMRHGKPIYYRDYDKVLSGEKSLEEVMGSSKIQWLIISLILRVLMKKLPFDKYEVATNEVGFKFAPRSWRNLDVAIFRKGELVKEGIDDRYVKTPPEVVVEVDTKADLRKYGDFMHYMTEKTQDLLNAGVKKVVWITTYDRKIMVAEKGERWFITDWDDTIEVIEGIELNIEKLLKESGYKGV